MFVRVWLIAKIPCPQWSYFIRMCLYKSLLCTKWQYKDLHVAGQNTRKPGATLTNPQWLILVWPIKRTQCWSLKWILLLAKLCETLSWVSELSLHVFRIHIFKQFILLTSLISSWFVLLQEDCRSRSAESSDTRHSNTLRSSVVVGEELSPTSNRLSAHLSDSGLPPPGASNHSKTYTLQSNSTYDKLSRG